MEEKISGTEDRGKHPVDVNNLDYRSLFETVPGMYLVLAPDLTILQASDAYLRATLTRREAIIGRGLFDVFPDNPADTSATGVMNLRSSLNYVLKNKVPHTMAVQKYDIRRPDGSFEIRYWSPINTPVMNENHAVKYIIHRVEDVTDFVFLQQKHERSGERREELRQQVRTMDVEVLKRSEEIQRLNEKLERMVAERTRKLEEINKDLSDYKFALDASSIVASTDQFGTITHVNENLCKISKYSREELIGQNHRILNSGYHSRVFFNDLWKTISSGKIWQGEIRNKAKDGQIYWVATTIVPFLDEQGRPFKYLSIRSDITERVHFLDQLKRSEEDYRNLYENTLAAIITTDMLTGKSITVNDAAVQLFGYESRQEFLFNFDMTMHFANPAEIDENTRILKEHGQLHSRVVQMKRQDGSYFWAKIFVKLNSTEEVAQTVLIDITEQVKARENLHDKVTELKISNRELESFNYIASHDLQEPLRKIRNFVSVLLQNEEKNLSQQGQFYLGRMSETSRQMQWLIEDLLTYSRTRNAPRVFEKANLDDILNEVKNSLSSVIAEKNAVIRSEKLFTADVIRFQIFQLLSNLISNALKFSHPDRRPEIIIRGEVVSGSTLNNAKLLFHENYYHLSVKDNGIGFDPKYSERIFGIFERLHPASKYKGTGIGLAICKRIVENHHGMITATGRPGQGAIFDVYLPA